MRSETFRRRIVEGLGRFGKRLTQTLNQSFLDEGRVGRIGSRSLARLKNTERFFRLGLLVSSEKREIGWSRFFNSIFTLIIIGRTTALQSEGKDDIGFGRQLFCKPFCL